MRPSSIVTIVGLVTVVSALGLGTFYLPERLTEQPPTLSELRATYSEELEDQEITLEALLGLNSADEVARAKRVDERQRFGGGVLAAALVAGGLYLNYRRTKNLEAQVELTRDQVELTRSQLAITEKGQLTDRFTKAVEQLGHETMMDIRFGGLYALEGLAKEAASRLNAGLDSQVPLQVIAAFVRRPRDESDKARVPGIITHDVQIAMDILGRSRRYLPRHAHNLRGAHLKSAQLQYDHLEGAHLMAAHLGRAMLVETHFEGAILVRAILERAHLEGAYLEGAHLMGAHLEGAYLEGAHLMGAHLEGALADEKTTWPAGWDRERAERAGVIFSG